MDVSLLAPRAVVLSFDRLPCGFLGCYGNDWIETPHLDRLATEGVVFDRHFAENLDPASLDHAWWTGRYECLRRVDAPRQESFLAALPDGTRSWLVTESDGQDSRFVAPPFTKLLAVQGQDALDAAEDQVPFARLVDAAVALLPEVEAHVGPTLLWLKSRGVPAPWLPPQGFADLYLEEFGLAGEHDAEDTTEAGSDSPAAVELKYARAMYSAYVSWLDRWTGKLLRTLDRRRDRDRTLLIVTAAAGQTLGERGDLACPGPLLREETIHAPLLVRLPRNEQAATRREALVQTVDLAPTLVDWLSNRIDAAADSPMDSSPFQTQGRSLLPLIESVCDSIRPCALCGSPEEWAVRDDDFLCVEQRCEPEAAAIPPLLFEKPHDRWDMSDVAAQRPQEVERLTAARRRWCDSVFGAIP